MTNTLLNENNELEKLKSKKQNLLLLVDGGEKRVKAARSRNEEKQVDENVMRLRVLQLEQITSNESDKVYDLEKYRLNLEAVNRFSVMRREDYLITKLIIKINNNVYEIFIFCLQALKERTAEIVAQKEALVVQKRVAGSECSELRVAIGERKGRIRQLQARYDSGIANLGATADGLPMTTAYMKIQSAQERYLLYERGDKLDETIRRTEQEIRSMENTLRVVNVCNDKYKDSVSTVDEDGPECMEQKTLDKQMYNARQKLCQRQEQLQKLFDELQKMQDEHSLLLDDIEKAKEEKEDKQRYLSSLEKQIAEQTEKISRADKNLRKVQKDIQNLYICKGDDSLLLQQVRRYKFIKFVKS